MPNALQAKAAFTQFGLFMSFLYAALPALCGLT